MSLLSRCTLRALPSLARCAARPAARPLCFAAPQLVQQLQQRRCFGSVAPTTPAPAAAKVSTHITGLDVVPNSREVYIGLLRETLASIAAYNRALPEGAGEPKFNEVIRRVTEHRLAIAEEETDVGEIERRIWLGQMEELIEMAENQLDLVVAMNEDAQPWRQRTPESQSYFDTHAVAQFGESDEVFRSGRPQPLTPEEQKIVDEFWAPIDAEIRADQEREKEERRARKAKQQ